MADSEAVVTQTSTVMSYTSAGYTPTDYVDTSSNDVPDTGGCAVGATGDLAGSTGPTDSAYTVPEGSNLGDGNTFNMDSVMQEAPASTTYETKQSGGELDNSVNLPTLENLATDSSQVTVHDSSVNGNAVSEDKNFTSVENGIASVDIGEATTEQHYEDGSVPAMSAEEDRLWSIVRANSLDFNAWTALIEETEKLAEDNILKIRKVYDAFLAEFPLCYGYWKKYADHEARLGSIDKVVEVYERAVLGVTYSVDIWLHYCIFAISTYGDPDTIRRSRPV